MGKILDLQHRLSRQDPYMVEISNAIGLSIDEINNVIADLKLQMSFKTMTWYADILANELGLNLPLEMSIDDKRSILEARWKSSGKVDVYLLQAVADSWRNGAVEVYFKDGHIQIKFVGAFGVPNDLDSLKKQIDLAKPAHLVVDYFIKYLLIKDVHQVLTIAEVEATPLSDFATGG